MKKGFSLLEVLVAMIILSIGISALNWSLGAYSKMEARDYRKFHVHQKLMAQAEELSGYSILNDSTWEEEVEADYLLQWEIQAFDSAQIEDVASDSLWDDALLRAMLQRPTEIKLIMSYTKEDSTYSKDSLFFVLQGLK